MILVDSSVWISHLRGSNEVLVELLSENQVLVHPFVLGEIACGNLKNRKIVLGLLDMLPQISRASDQEVLALIEHQKLMGQGIGYVDAHLLAAVFLFPGSRLWTQDKRLASVSRQLEVLH